MDVKSLKGCVEVLESQGTFMLDCQEQDNNKWEIFHGHCLEFQEVERKSRS